MLLKTCPTKVKLVHQRYFVANVTKYDIFIFQAIFNLLYFEEFLISIFFIDIKA